MNSSNLIYNVVINILKIKNISIIRITLSFSSKILFQKL